MLRRQFLLAAAAALRAQTGPPNVLFRITRDQSWLHTAVTGSPWIL